MQFNFTHFIPTKRCSALLSIQHFIRHHAYTSLKAIVVGKFHKRQVFIPNSLEINNISPQHFFKHLNCPLGLTIYLGMISCAKLQSTRKIRKTQRHPHRRVNARVAPGNVTQPHTWSCECRRASQVPKNGSHNHSTTQNSTYYSKCTTKLTPKVENNNDQNSLASHLQYKLLCYNDLFWICDPFFLEIFGEHSSHMGNVPLVLALRNAKC